MAKGPFLYDVMGSMLRPEPLKEAREAFRQGAISLEELIDVEDKEIRSLVDQLVARGYEVVTDGEFRRGWYHSDFLGHLNGIELSTYTMNLFGEDLLVGSTKIIEQISWNEAHPFIQHFQFLKAEADKHGVTAKLDIPGPNMVLIDTITTEQENYYGKDIRALAADFVSVYQAAILSFYEAGCRYLQLDDPVWIAVVDERFKQRITNAGFDVEEVRSIFFETAKEILSVKPADMAITLHICQGNLRSKKFYDTTYHDIVDTIFSLSFDGFFLEFDDEKYCDFTVLEKLQGQKVVLGLVSTQSSHLEEMAVLVERARKASQYVDKSQICISTQCGFASTVEGNIITEEAQWAKVDLVRDIAKEL